MIDYYTMTLSCTTVALSISIDKMTSYWTWACPLVWILAQLEDVFLQMVWMMSSCESTEVKIYTANGEANHGCYAFRGYLYEPIFILYWSVARTLWPIPPLSQSHCQCQSSIVRPCRKWFAIWRALKSHPTHETPQKPQLYTLSLLSIAISQLAGILVIRWWLWNCLRCCNRWSFLPNVLWSSGLSRRSAIRWGHSCFWSIPVSLVPVPWSGERQEK